MMAFKSLEFFADYPNGMLSETENYARTCDLVSRLGKVHPLFTAISPKGAAGSWKRMEAEPLVKDMTPEYWIKEYNRWKMFDLSTLMPFWNRIRGKKESMIIDCNFNNSGETFHNQCYIGELGSAFVHPDIMDGIARAFIDSFDCYRTQYLFYIEGPQNTNYDGDGREYTKGKLLSRFYQLWTKEGIPFPAEGIRSRYPADHIPPSITEPWHGGTRYTWPEYEPRAFLGLDAAE